MINRVFVLSILGVVALAAIWLLPDRDKALDETPKAAPQATTSLLPQRQASLSGFRPCKAWHKRWDWPFLIQWHCMEQR